MQYPKEGLHYLREETSLTEHDQHLRIELNPIEKDHQRKEEETSLIEHDQRLKTELKLVEKDRQLKEEENSLTKHDQHLQTELNREKHNQRPRIELLGEHDQRLKEGETSPTGHH